LYIIIRQLNMYTLGLSLYEMMNVDWLYLFTRITMETMI